MTFQMFRFVEAGRLESSHFKYRITGVNNDKSMCVSPKKFGRLYYEGRIVGNIPTEIRNRLGLYREPRNLDKQKKALRGIVEIEVTEDEQKKIDREIIHNNWMKASASVVQPRPLGYGLPSVWNAEKLEE